MCERRIIPELPVNDGDAVTKFAWVFVGGKFNGQEVLPTLRDYLDHTEQLIDEAERFDGPTGHFLTSCLSLTN
jgi:hypothetical protein